MLVRGWMEPENSVWVFESNISDRPVLFPRYEDVISGLISAKLSNPDLRIVDNTAMLSFNALVFSMRALIAEANDLENTVRELLQVNARLLLTSLVTPVLVASV